MKIRETKERECCAFGDLKPVEGSPKRGQVYDYVFCQHCGARHRMFTFTDPAGASDWGYKKIPESWS
jgi:hypothetical protein